MSLVRVKRNPAAVLDPLHPPTHQAGKDRHHHFLIDLHQVFRESVDASSDLPRHRDGISVGGEAHTHSETVGMWPLNRNVGRNKKKPISLCIVQLVVFRESAGFYQLIVDAVGLDGIYQFHYRQTAADLLVLVDTFPLRLRQQNVPCAVATGME